ncbi:Spy/CpxP family protein refolding chaperone [Vampirovibrio sp.]|uniref:Spy/CpxP family protein refolding chaperone n=1 Tax=Vampirovibrio sp. TaxID=2717857 RepID=UPI003594659F
MSPIETLNETLNRACLSLGIAVVLTGCFFSLAQASDINWGHLNLTPQQQTQMQHLENGWHKTHQTVGSQIEKDMAELKTILPTGDSQKIRELQTRIMTNKTYLMNESMDTFLKKREMLSPPQRAQLQKMIPCNTPAAAPVVTEQADRENAESAE